ncbi:MAG: efflux RND transporter permease subunit [Planctomycetota bacterium]
MDLLKLAITKPVGVTVGVILVVMFGLIGIGSIPVQLTPTVDRPIVSVTTNWAGRSPQEIIDEIVKEQEEQLKSIGNLKKMSSTTSEGTTTVTLEFFIGTNIDRSLQEVSDKLRQVPEYPEDVDEPTVEATEGDVANAITWIIIDVHPDKREKWKDFDISTLLDPIENEVKPRIERVDGIAEVNVYGGREREMRVLVDPVRLAQRGLNHIDVAEALRAENRNVSAGSIAEGKRDYRVRVLGQFTGTQDLLSTIIAYRDGGPVYLSDVAEVELGHVKRRGFVRSVGDYAIAMNASRRTGANVIEVMNGLYIALDDIEQNILPLLNPEVGDDLRLRQVYDETLYIHSAIGLVSQNLWIGGVIAAIVLLLFLRSFVATGVIALAIPISVVGTFLVLLALGRSLNVISLAGLAFAVGMVVDNAIVVLENIDRHRTLGKHPLRAAYDGGREVWGAILASTLTTIAVFIPILTIQEEAGQLFRDIALAIVASVSLSLIVSITVIPAACGRWLGHYREPTGVRKAFKNLFGLATFAGWVSRTGANIVHWLITGWRGWTLRPAIIVVLTVLSLFAAAKLMPPLDYLPAGNRNLVFGGLLIPPGYSVDQMESIAERIESRLNPYAYASEDSVAELPKIVTGFGDSEIVYEPVGIQNYFIGAFNGGMFVGGTSRQEQVVAPVGARLSQAMNSIPDAFGFAAQSSLFNRGLTGGNTIDIEISGLTLDGTLGAANALFGALGASPKYGFDSGRPLRPDPSNFNLSQPEWQVRLTPLGRELGLRTDGIGTAVRALFDGAFVGEFRTSSDNIDIRLLPEGGELDYKEQLASVPVATPAGPIVPLDTLLEFVPAEAPQAIQRIEELPSVRLLITPPEGEPIESVMADLQENYIEPLRASGAIDPTIRVRLEGTAEKLNEVRASLLGVADEEPNVAAARFGNGAGLLMVGVGLLLACVAGVRAITRKKLRLLYGSAGALLLFGTLAVLFVGLGDNPQFMTARFIWALAVTYLLMCALFESFIYPFVIMFTVPLAIVGGFAGLRIVHDWSVANPLVQPQNLDVLTMLGFIILIGVVVNNAILIVHQSLNLMRGQGETRVTNESSEPLPMSRAIAEAVRTRMRPVFMSTLTSVGGMLPLVLFPGAGSELYRGLGSVVVGGLLVATFFTLLLVPLLFSLVLDMRLALRESLRSNTDPPTGPDGAPREASFEERTRSISEILEPAMARGDARPAT